MCWVLRATSAPVFLDQANLCIGVRSSLCAVDRHRAGGRRGTAETPSPDGARGRNSDHDKPSERSRDQ